MKNQERVRVIESLSEWAAKPRTEVEHILNRVCKDCRADGITDRLPGFSRVVSSIVRKRLNCSRSVVSEGVNQTLCIAYLEFPISSKNFNTLYSLQESESSRLGADSKVLFKYNKGIFKNPQQQTRWLKKFYPTTPLRVIPSILDEIIAINPTYENLVVVTESHVQETLSVSINKHNGISYDFSDIDVITEGRSSDINMTDRLLYFVRKGKYEEYKGCFDETLDERTYLLFYSHLKEIAEV